MIEKKYDYYGASGIIDKVDDYLFDGTYILIAEDGANLLMRNSPLAFLATGKFWVNNHAHILKPQFGNDQYFVYLLESLDYSLYVTGAAQPKLTKENLGKYKIIIPPRDEQNTISNFLDNKAKELAGLIENIVTQISTLRQYRKSLIHECVTGKRRITDDDVQDQL
jgi:type I restriction enzyme, S subunit